MLNYCCYLVDWAAAAVSLGYHDLSLEEALHAGFCGRAIAKPIGDPCSAVPLLLPLLRNVFLDIVVGAQIA